MLDAGKLRARHGVAADKIHRPGQYLGGLHNGPLDPAHVGDQAPRLKIIPVLREKSHDILRVDAQEGHIGLPNGGGHVQGGLVPHGVAERILHRGLSPGYPHHFIVLKSLQGQGQGPADKSKPHDSDGFVLHQKHLLFHGKKGSHFMVSSLSFKSLSPHIAPRWRPYPSTPQTGQG